MANKKSAPKHALWIRWTHWINFPLLSFMVWSGLMIYWSNDVYFPPIPSKFYEFFNLDHRLAEAMYFHFFFMWLFSINGFLYVSYLIFSGEWRELLPNRKTLNQAFQVILHDLGFRKKELNQGKFNGAQRIAYTSVVIMGVGSLLTGLAIYKPIQLSFLKNIFGGYEFARRLHFWLTLLFVGFFFVHIAQVARAGWTNFTAIIAHKRLKLGFISLLVFLIFFFSLFKMVRDQSQVEGSPKFFRAVLNMNAKIFESIYDPSKKDIVATAPTRGKKPRVNGDLGLTEVINIKNWKLKVEAPVGSGTNTINLEVTLDELKKLPQTEVINQFKCIEGWSEVISSTGVKFSDFLKKYKLGTHSGQAPDFKGNRSDLYRYVGLETPDGEYYVNIDMPSMLSEQTILAYEMNGTPLSLDNGAPLRLIIPSKYGIKNIKRIAKIQFSDERLPDYWGEQGYDWFSGL